MVRLNEIEYDKLYEIAKRAAVHFSAYIWRRFYATYLYRNGVGIEEIRQLLGHSKISTTQEYLKITQDDVINDPRSRKIDFLRVHFQHSLFVMECSWRE